jgi:uncharacterized protein involved in propanediol utilization
VVKLFKDQLLQLVSRLTLAGVDASLSKQVLGINFGLGKQQPKANVLGRQKLRRRLGFGTQMALVLMTIDFEHC